MANFLNYAEQKLRDPFGGPHGSAPTVAATRPNGVAGWLSGVQNQMSNTAGSPRTPIHTRSGVGYLAPTKVTGGQRVSGVPTDYLGQVKAQKTTAAPKLASFKQTPTYKFGTVHEIGGNVGQAQQGDWGLNAAALAQVDLIKSWGQENMAAAGESAIARGMGRSGAYDAALAVEMDKSRMEAASQIATAAAEAGRINSGIAQSNAANALAAAQSNQGAYLQSDQMQAGYNTDLRAQNLADYLGRTNTALNYAQLNEGARQFNNSLALDQTNSNRGYQGQMLGYNEGIRQFNTTAGQAATNANRDYQMAQAGLAQSGSQFDAQLAQNADQYGQTLGQTQAEFNYKKALDAGGAGTSGPSYADITGRLNSKREAMSNPDLQYTVENNFGTPTPVTDPKTGITSMVKVADQAAWDRYFAAYGY